MILYEGGPRYDTRRAMGDINDYQTDTSQTSETTAKSKQFGVQVQKQWNSSTPHRPLNKKP